MKKKLWQNHVCIFGRSRKSLTKYQEKINEIAVDFCAENPAFLIERGKLLELAKDRVHVCGFVYAKGKSRAKKFHIEEEEERPKRNKIDREDRQHRIESLKLKKHQ